MIQLKIVGDTVRMVETLENYDAYPKCIHCNEGISPFVESYIYGDGTSRAHLKCKHAIEDRGQ